ncbi:SDR family oxidoreductase [Hyphomicrobium facile]|uniref:DUF4166 domain-containing protein n=1 Tax=Hyphomicrobium facile TaxID=51670 RepID=A0A1I7NQ96_9HYPH|nr:SDR family oxidoreductase [Hyphomicrobium facile]SFV36750.1 protein of unknown function [Hyphomicrobium facile]
MLRRIVLIGATGFFGRRLARRLATIPDVALTLTSRSEERARDFAKTLEGGEHITPFSFDRDDASSVTRLGSLSPWLVIDASGPFQSAGYDLARAAIGFGAHWIDLADARDYLLGFSAALDAEARKMGVVARAGASSTPALSMAVVTEVTDGWQRVDGVDIAILPGGAGDVGDAVIRAILSYAGAKITVYEEGSEREISGWGSVTRAKIAGLGTRYLSPVETADASLMQHRFDVASRVSFSAGLQSRIEHFGLVALAQLRWRRMISRPEALAPLLGKARRVTRVFATDRGGMTITCAGLDANGRQICARWFLHAEKGSGPDVPVLPAVALTRSLLRGEGEAGAGIAALPLAAIEAEMSRPSLTTTRTTQSGGDTSLLALACGVDAYRRLPSALRAFHDQTAPPVWAGKADIDASNSIIGRFVRAIVGLPSPARGVDVTVTVDRAGGEEIWQRNFGGQRFASRLAYKGKNVVSERFGSIEILMAIDVDSIEVRMPVAGWRIGRIRLPLMLAPTSKTREFVGDDGRFHFDVSIGLPGVGLLAHYRGWLEPKTSHALKRSSVASSCAD